MIFVPFSQMPLNARVWVFHSNIFFSEKEVRAALRILFSEGIGVISPAKEVEIFVKEPNSNIQSHICNRRINSSKGRF